MRAEAASPAEINREHPAQALHPGHGCRGSVVVGFAVSFAQRMSADLRVAATPAARCGWEQRSLALGKVALEAGQMLLDEGVEHAVFRAMPLVTQSA